MSPEVKAPKAKRGFDPRIARIRAMQSIVKQLAAAGVAQHKANKRIAAGLDAREAVLAAAGSEAERAALAELIAGPVSPPTPETRA